MRFALDEKQQAVADLAGEVLDGSGADAPERAWKALGQAGLLALAVPTRLGGDGLGMVETGVLLAEVGRRAVPVPALATLALGVLPVTRWGSDEQQEDLLAGVAAAGTVLTAAVREPSEPMPAVPRTTVRDGLLVTGTKVGVAYAEQAHRILVPVAASAGGSAVAIVDPRAPGVSLTRTPVSGATPEYTMRMDGVRATGMLGAATAADVYRYAIAGTCAVGDGVLAGALALTTAHIGTREQFGRPLAAFQAVAQQIADVYVASRTVRLAALSACWRLSVSTSDCDAELDVAAYWLAQEGPPALRTCHHLHGGIGLDISYPLHRYSALMRDMVRSLGGADYRLDRLDVHRPD
jgi:3-oxo-4-pregnene-20-carboxyl-CoA dehydrogenase alpha subunit